LKIPKQVLLLWLLIFSLPVVQAAELTFSRLQ
jgi:hypothetical protein